jgi:glycosyltransferase involved in cell wall biosynthesis
MGLVVVMSVDLSVVIPCYNSAATIERALDSIAQQTLLPNDVIVVDNASSDRTCEIIEQFAHKHPQVKTSLTRLNKNVGPSAARNIGWDQSQTSLIAFLDADDSWHPTKLELQCAVVDNHPDYHLFGHTYQVISPKQQPPLVACGTSQVRYFTLRHFLIRNRVSTPTVIVRRNIAFRFPSEMWFAEDLALWTQILSSGTQAVILDRALTYLHKAAYGVAGLSSRLREMHSGELAVIDQLRNRGAISRTEHTLAKIWMKSKYSRRVIRGRSSE